MSQTSNSFDLRQAVEGLFGLVQDKLLGSKNVGVKPQPEGKQLEAAVLFALETGTKNTTQVLQTLAISAGGAWTPSESQVNQVLSALLDSGLITSKTKGDRKVFTITNAGEEALAEARHNVASEPESSKSKTTTEFDWMICDPRFLKSASKLTPVLLDIAQTGTRAQQARAAEILDKVRHDLHSVLVEK